MEQDNPFSKRYDFIGWDPGSEEGDSSTYSVISGQGSTLSMEDIQEAMRKVEELMPKPRMNAILISERLPRGISWIRDYKGKIYMIFNKQDLEAELHTLEARGLLQHRGDIGRYIVEGTLGSIAGVPIIQDEDLIVDILMEEIRAKFLLHRLQGVFEAGIIVFPPRVEWP